MSMSWSYHIRNGHASRMAAEAIRSAASANKGLVIFEFMNESVQWSGGDFGNVWLCPCERLNAVTEIGDSVPAVVGSGHLGAITIEDTEGLALPRESGEGGMKAGHRPHKRTKMAVPRGENCAKTLW
jgi:hypothetical protein